MLDREVGGDFVFRWLSLFVGCKHQVVAVVVAAAAYDGVVVAEEKLVGVERNSMVEVEETHLAEEETTEVVLANAASLGLAARVEEGG